MSRRKSARRSIEPYQFRDLRNQRRMTRFEVAKALDVTPRTVQNWETGGARIPWMAYRMLRILCGYALPGKAWEGWTVCGGQLLPPVGRPMDILWLEQFQYVYAQARLWRQGFAASGKPLEVSNVLPFPDRRPALAPANSARQGYLKRLGGNKP
ncbi:MAG: VC1465 family Xer recombination activation factor [Sideroxydans sp.]|nr:VC1465 family Xer recombination activation factor [Sideroxydans sp.]